ncbi:MAG TPA: hypothetical protein VF188_15630 [Longimicrobiales bacterium]
MIGAIATLVGYTRKPKATFFLKHPVKAIRIKKFQHDVKDTITSQRFILGISAAAVALPLGFWLGRKLM